MSLPFNEYDINDVVTLSFDVVDAGGAYRDPDVVRFKYRFLALGSTVKGAQVSKQYGVDVEVKRSATGRFYLDFTCEAAGLVFYRWEGVGTYDVAEEGYFRVKASNQA